jgi:hypothetical protein
VAHRLHLGLSNDEHGDLPRRIVVSRPGANRPQAVVVDQIPTAARANAQPFEVSATQGAVAGGEFTSVARDGGGADWQLQNFNQPGWPFLRRESSPQAKTNTCLCARLVNSHLYFETASGSFDKPTRQTPGEFNPSSNRNGCEIKQFFQK